MSFDIRWETICEDAQLTGQLREFLNSKLAAVELPHYLANLQVVGFRFGETAPAITIRDISVPFDEFYAAIAGDDTDEPRKTDEYDEINTKIPQPRPQMPTPASYAQSIPMTPRTNNVGSGSYSTSPSPSPYPFINNTSGFLMPRNNSGIVPISQFGAGIANFGVAGGGNATPTGHIRNGGNTLLDYSNSSRSYMDSESDYFQHNESFNNYAGSESVSENDEESDIEQSEQSEVDTDETSSSGKGMDVQLSVDIDWDSQLYIEITCDLLVNYPAPEFIRLPVRLKITDLKIHSLMIIAYIAKRVFISFLCDIEDESEENDVADGDADTSGVSPSELLNNLHIGDSSRQNSKYPIGSGTSTTTRKKGKERIDIIQDMNIEGEIGSLEAWRQDNMMVDVDGNGLVLRNIGKIENFLMGTMRALIIDELGWPGWIELDFNDDESDNEDRDHDPEHEVNETGGVDVDDGYLGAGVHEHAVESDAVSDNSDPVPVRRRSSRFSKSSRQTHHHTTSVSAGSVHSQNHYFTSDEECL